MTPRKKKTEPVAPATDEPQAGQERGEEVKDESQETSKPAEETSEDTAKAPEEEKADEQPKKTAPPPVDKRPHYKCHKTVHAHQIAGVKVESDGTAVITPAEPGFSQIRLAPPFAEKFSPTPGMYLVYYSDGYTSVSPAQAFEDGYKLIKD